VLHTWQEYGEIIADKQVYFKDATSLCTECLQHHFWRNM